MTMKIKLYDRVLLNDGCEATIVEIFEEDKLFIADIDKDGDTDTEELSIDNNERTIESQNTILPGFNEQETELIKSGLHRNLSFASHI